MNTSAAQAKVQRRLAAFTSAGYDKGAGRLKRALWVAFGQPIQASLFCPPAARSTILRVFGATIGDGVLIRHGVRVHWPWKLSIGADSWIGVGAWLLNLERITIGSNVCISQQVLLCTGSHNAKDPFFEFDNGSITIQDGAWVAVRATVLRGVKVGEGAVVGACALAVRDVADYTSLMPPSGTVR